MTDTSQIDDVYFEVLTPLGFRVRVTRAYWQLISTVKHPVMEGHEQEVQETLQAPCEIRLSRSDAAVFLFYGTRHQGRWVCAVARRLDCEGFLITAYPTDAVKEGEHIWPR